MIKTKCSKCNSVDDSAYLLGYYNELDPTSDIIDEDGNKIRKIESYVTVCNNCGETTTITQSDNPSEIGQVNMYKLTKKSKNDKGIRKFTSNNIKDFLA